MSQVKPYLKNFYRYRGLFSELVKRDIKLKYRRSILGYLWSVLNPLLIMLVMVVVFSTFFRFDIENFPVYLLTGQTLFGFFTEATSMAIASIIGNAALIKKTYVPKYIFTVSRVTSSLVTLIFSMTALALVMVITRVHITFYALLAPLVLLQLYVFCLGMGMFLAAASVFFRDVQYLWGVVTTAWMYLTPLFYPESIWPEAVAPWLRALNPMYHYITQFRQAVLWGEPLATGSVAFGCLYAVLALAVGIAVFRRGQDRFILYI